MRTAPADMHAEAHAILRDRPRHQQELFGLRLDRWWRDLDDALTAVYGPERAPDLERRLVRIAATAFGERDPEMHRLDLQRTLDPAWFQDESMLGYACYTERFAGDLAALIDKIDYLRELGITYLHLMPLLQPRDGDSDGGYAVADYRRVRTDLGSMADLRKLAAELRAAGISLVMDLVLNHVAAEHPWAQADRGRAFCSQREHHPHVGAFVRRVE